jgi:membrane-associated phospholipid phosphatase
VTGETGNAAARLRARWLGVCATDRVKQLAPLLVALVLVAVGLTGAALLLDGVRENADASRVDAPAWSWLVEHRDGPATWFFTAVTTVSGETVLPVLVVIAAGLWAWRLRQWWQAGLLIAAMVGATAASTLTKLAAARGRPPTYSMIPPVETSYSFPSGHTLGAATLLLVLGYLLWRRNPTRRFLLLWSGFTAAVVAAVALSRLYLGYHWPTDVAASVCLALVVLGGIIAIDTVQDRFRARQPRDPP